MWFIGLQRVAIIGRGTKMVGNHWSSTSAIYFSVQINFRFQRTVVTCKSIPQCKLIDCNIQAYALSPYSVKTTCTSYLTHTPTTLTCITYIGTYILDALQHTYKECAYRKHFMLQILQTLHGHQQHTVAQILRVIQTQRCMFHSLRDL